MPIRFFVTCVVTVLLTSSLSAQDQLQWKLRSNEQLKYTVVQNMESTTVFGDESIKSSFNQAIDMSWKILAVGADGNIQLHQVFDRVRLKMMGGPAGLIEFDTASRTTPESPVIKALADVFGNIVGQQFQVAMASSGQVSHVKVPEQLLTAVRESAAGQSNALTEEMLVDMMKQSAVLLPQRTVRPGDTWQTEQNVQMPFGKMTITSAMTYKQKDTMGNAIIDFVPTVKITPREGASTQMTLNNAIGNGRVIFDIARGRLNKTQLDLTMQMTMNVNGQKLPQTIHNRTSMTLVP